MPFKLTGNLRREADMKTFKTKLIVLLAAFSVLGVGCGKSSEGGSQTYQPPILDNDGSTPVSPDGPGTGTGTVGGQTATFQPVSIQEFNSYVALHPLNAPTDFKITVSLQDAGNGRFAGSVKLGYTDTGYNYNATFEAGSGNNVKMSGLKDNGVMEAEYNRWFILNGQYYFSAYFSDNYGAIVLVFDSYVNQGDGQGTGTLTGKVYYRNFAQSYAPQSPYRKCWFIYDGPYMCRSNTVMNKSSAVPDGYRYLGKFSGLSKASAFNE
jgi:hypothetical protein